MADTTGEEEVNHQEKAIMTNALHAYMSIHVSLTGVSVLGMRSQAAGTSVPSKRASGNTFLAATKDVHLRWQEKAS